MDPRERQERDIYKKGEEETKKERGMERAIEEHASFLTFFLFHLFSLFARSRASTSRTCRPRIVCSLAMAAGCCDAATRSRAGAGAAAKEKQSSNKAKKEEKRECGDGEAKEKKTKGKKNEESTLLLFCCWVLFSSKKNL